MLINKEPDTMLSQFTPCFSSLSNDTTLKMSSLTRNMLINVSLLGLVAAVWTRLV